MFSNQRGRKYHATHYTETQPGFSAAYAIGDWNQDDTSKHGGNWSGHQDFPPHLAFLAGKRQGNDKGTNNGHDSGSCNGCEYCQEQVAHNFFQEDCFDSDTPSEEEADATYDDMLANANTPEEHTLLNEHLYQVYFWSTNNDSASTPTKVQEGRDLNAGRRDKSRAS